MKKLFFARFGGLLFLVLTSILIQGCDSGGGGSEDSPNNEVVQGTVSALVGGEQFVATSVSATFVDHELHIIGQVNAGTSSVRKIEITVREAYSTGGYDFPFKATVLYHVGVEPNYNKFVSHDGSLSLNKISAVEASGTFSFYGQGYNNTEIHVSFGEFDVSL